MSFEFSDELYAKLKFACEYRVLHGQKAAEKLWLQLELPTGVAPAAECVVAGGLVRAGGEAVSELLHRFLKDCTVKSPGARVQSAELYRAFEAWCKSRSESACSHKAFTMSMDVAGFQRKASNQIWFLDIRLTRSASARR